MSGDSDGEELSGYFDADQSWQQLIDHTFDRLHPSQRSVYLQSLLFGACSHCHRPNVPGVNCCCWN